MTWIRNDHTGNIWDSEDGKHRIIPVHRNNFIRIPLHREDETGNRAIHGHAYPTLGAAMNSIEEK